MKKSTRSTPGTVQSPRRRGRWWKTLVVIVAVLLVVVGVAPTLVSMTIGTSIVAGAVGKSFNGTVTVDDVSLTWFGKQTVRNLKIVDGQGEILADVSATLHQSLLSLLIGSAYGFDVDVSGYVNATIEPDGSTNVQRAVRTRPPRHEKDEDKPFSLPPTSVTLDGMTLTLHHRERDIDATISLNKASLISMANGDVEIQFDAASTSQGVDGVLLGEISARKLFSPQGMVSPGGASLKAQIEGRSLPWLLGADGGKIDQLMITAASDDVTQDILLRVDAAGNVGASVTAEAASTLHSDLTLRQLIQADGRLTPGIENISGQVVGSKVPVSLLQPWLADTAVIAERDLGTFADVSVQFSQGESRTVTAHVETQHAQLTFSGQVDASTGALNSDAGSFRAAVQPSLASSFGLTTDRPIDVNATLTTLQLPPRAADGASQSWQTAAFSGLLTVTPQAPLTIQRSDQEHLSLNVDTMRIAFDTPELRSSIRVKGTAGIDDASLAFDQEVRDLFDANGTMVASNAHPAGTLSVSNLTSQLLARLMPEQSGLIAAAVESPMAFTVETSSAESGLAILASMTSRQHSGQLKATLTRDALMVQEADMRPGISPQLVEQILKPDEGESTIATASPFTAHVSLEPFSVVRTDAGGFDLTELSPRGTIQAAQIDVSRAPSLSNNVILSEINGSFAYTTQPAAQTSVTLRAKARSAGGDEIVELVMLESTVRMDETDTLPRVRIIAKNTRVAGVEHATGREAGSLSKWLGAGGDLTASIDPSTEGFAADLEVVFPNVKGSYRAQANDDVFVAASKDPKNDRITLPRASLQQFLSASASDGKSKEGATRSIVVESNLTFVPEVRSLTIPMAALRGEPFNPAAATIDLALTAQGPLTYTIGTAKRQTIDNLKLALSSNNLREGLTIKGGGRVTADGESKSGGLNLDGAIFNLIDDQQRLDQKNAQVNLDLRADALPTMVLDALAGFEGMLVAAIGPQIDGQLNAQGFSANSGRLEGQLTSSNGFLKGRVRGHDQSIRTFGDVPINAELALTEALTSRLLYRLHPIFADVRSVEHPIRIKVDNTGVPLDGNLRRLKADINIDVGNVQLDSGSTLLALLTIFQSSVGRTVPAFIEPIDVRIREGIVTYERFRMRVDKHTLAYSGTIDLHRKKVDLRTELPLKNLALSIEELRGISDDIVVPIVTRGSFGDLKTEIDPKFDIGEAIGRTGLDVLINQGLNELIKELDKR